MTTAKKTRVTVAQLDARTVAMQASLASLEEALDRQAKTFESKVHVLQEQIQELQKQQTPAPAGDARQKRGGVRCGKCSRRGGPSVLHPSIAHVKTCYGF